MVTAAADGEASSEVPDGGVLGLVSNAAAICAASRLIRFCASSRISLVVTMPSGIPSRITETTATTSVETSSRLRTAAPRYVEISHARSGTPSHGSS